MVLPINNDSNTIGYDTKFLISNEGRYPPITWKISKIQPKITGGVVYFTMTQEQYNPDKDNAELMIADYWQSAVEPMPEENRLDDLEFTYSGSPSIKAGGSYKKITLKHLIGDDKIEVDIGNDIDIHWRLESDDIDIKNNIECLTNKEDEKLKFNEIKIKCLNNYLLIGKTFKIIATIIKKAENNNLNPIIFEKSMVFEVSSI